jgi:acetyl-CoA carboxylase/biotin carboxylase 1
MAAVKAIRSIRKWSFDTFNSMLVTFIVMCTPEDLSVNAEYIRIADQFVEIPGGASHYNYNNVELIVETAQRVQADAVYVGWGYQSENPYLAERLLQNGVVFMGPPPVLEID